MRIERIAKGLCRQIDLIPEVTGNWGKSLRVALSGTVSVVVWFESEISPIGLIFLKITSTCIYFVCACARVCGRRVVYVREHATACV